MSPFLKAKAFYGDAWPGLFESYLRDEFVYSSPTCFVMAHPEGDMWWIEYLAGDIAEALNHLPYWLPKIAYARGRAIRTYWTASLVRKLLKSTTLTSKAERNEPTSCVCSIN